MKPTSSTARQLPQKPDGISLESVFAGVHWHQKWELFEGVFTPGVVDVEDLCTRVGLPADLTGKRVIDIGGWQGCCSFECERRGASDVVTYSLENPNASGFNRMKSLLDSKVEYVQGTAYALSPEDVGQFDVVLFFGVIYHLRYPLLAFDKIRSISRGDVYIETHVIDDCWITREPGSGFEKPEPLPDVMKRVPLWQQYEAYELHPTDASNWFGPNNLAVIEGFESAGFDVELVGNHGYRGFFKARVRDGLPDRTKFATYESRVTHDAELVGVDRVSYDPLFEPVDCPPADGEPRDSRGAEGLLAELDVHLEETRAPLGGSFCGKAMVKNTGSAVWLPHSAGIGGVGLIVQLHAATGEHIEDHKRFPLRNDDRPVLPGETVEVEIRIEATTKGSWQLDFDLVAENLFPFQFRTNMPRRFPVEVT